MVKSGMPALGHVILWDLFETLFAARIEQRLFHAE